MMNHRCIKRNKLFINLFLINLKFVPSTRAETSNTFNKSFLFINDSYTLKNTAIRDAFIILEKATILISNFIVISSKILARGRTDYSVIIKNSVFENSKIMIDSDSNVTIVHSQFLMEDIGKDEEPSHLIKVYNVGILLMTDTHFGNKSIQDTQKYTGNSEMKSSTTLGRLDEWFYHSTTVSMIFWSNKNFL